MKLTTSDAFEKHLDEALPDHPSTLYGVFVKDPFERRFAIQGILRRLQGREVVWLCSSEDSPGRFEEEIQTQSLFSRERIVIYDEIEDVDLQPLPADLIVILGGASSPRFYEKVKKEAVILDLSAEKPWDRKGRLKRWLMESVRREGKVLSSDAATFLLENTTWNFAQSLQEMQKALLFVGESKEIDLAAVKKTCSTLSPELSWGFSEAVIWGGNPSSFDKVDISALHQLIGQFRYHLQMGLTIASCIERKEEGKITKEYPKLRPKTLERYKALAKKRGTSYFSDGLHQLFDLEMHMRSGVSKATLFLDLFIAKLQCWTKN